MKPIFITGGAGFIGSHLASKLQDDIVCYDNLSTGKQENTDHLVEGDILDYDKLVSSMAGSEAVFHLAAFSDIRAGMEHPERDFFNNLIGTHNVLMAMRQNKIRDIVFLSTCAVYGDAPEPRSEDDQLYPISPYALEKMKCEWLIQGFVKQYDMRTLIFRPGSVIGGNMQNGMIRNWVLKLKEDNTQLQVLGGAKTSRPFIHIDDCVDGILRVFSNSSKSYQVFNLASSGSVNVDEVVKIMLEEAGLKDTKVIFEPQDRGWEGSAIEVKLNVDKLRKFGWEASLSPTDAIKKASKEILEYQEL